MLPTFAPITYKVEAADRIIAVTAAGTFEEVPIAKWGNAPDRALSILCALLGETPTPKRLKKENLRALKYVKAFRREFSRGFDLQPGQEIGTASAAIWLRRQGVQL